MNRTPIQFGKRAMSIAWALAPNRTAYSTCWPTHMEWIWESLQGRLHKVDLATVFTENEAVTLILNESRDSSTNSLHTLFFDCVRRGSS